jgi:hypothetical protein
MASSRPAAYEQTMTPKGSLIVAAVALVAAVVGCDRQNDGGLFAVKQGATRPHVRAVSGIPYRSGSRCRLYGTRKKGASSGQLRFCFEKNGRVSLIQTAANGATALASGRKQAKLALIRSVLATRSGILAPFRPPRLGRKRCLIARGGPTEKLVPGDCQTRLIRRARERLVIFTESWSAREFRGSGARFRQPDSRPRLQTSWLITVTADGKVGRTTIRGDFPPQLVF